jgi:DNA-binding transcriptional regulator YiaG
MIQAGSQAATPVSPAFIRKTRAKLKLSRGVFARKLYTNVRTLENWEQGREYGVL